MVEISYHGRPLALGPQSFFRLSCGAKPSFGFFRATKADVDYFLVSLDGAPGDLVFSDVDNTVTLHRIYLVKCSSVSATTTAVYDIVVADERILWQYKYGSSNYNTYPADRNKGSGGDFDLENLNAGSEWTFGEIRAELKALLGLNALTASDFSLTRKPRNIIGENKNGICVLQQYLTDLNAYAALDPQATNSTCYIFPVGTPEQAADTSLIASNAYRLHQWRDVRLNPKVAMGGTIKMLAAADPTQAPGRLLTYGSKSAGGSFSYFVPSMYAVYGNEENAAALGTIGNEVAQEYVDSFQNTWRDSIYAGFIPFKLNRAIHEITWQLTEQGAFTRIRSFRPRETLDNENLRDTLFSYYRYLIGSGGGGGVRRAEIQSFDTTTPPGFYNCKLLDSEENTPGDTIPVYPIEHLGTEDPGDANNIDGDVWPDYISGDVLAVFKDVDGKWYTAGPIDNKTVC